METIVAHPRSDDGAYGVWMDSQSDCWYDELEEEEVTAGIPQMQQLPLFAEVDELALELCEAEGLPFTTAVVEAGRRMLGLQAYARDWDRPCWVGGNEACAAF
jgi:hypothetical protein